MDSFYHYHQIPIQEYMLQKVFYQSSHVAFSRHYLQARYFKKYRIAIMSYIKNVTDSDIIQGYPTSYCTTVKHHIHHMKDIEYDIFEIEK